MLQPKLYKFRIDLTTATPGELQTLPGIGPKLAESIVRYRDRHAPMQEGYEILHVSGIGEKKYRAIQPYLAN